MRRNKGEGLIRKHTSGRWEARITINGKQKSFYGDTEKEAKKKLRDFKSKVDRGQNKLNKIQYTDLLDIWLERKEKNLKPQSYHRLVATVETHIKPIIGFYFLDKLHHETIQSDVINEKFKHLGFSSVKKIYDALNESLRFAKSDGYILNNPVELVVMPKQASFVKDSNQNENKLEIFTIDEIKRIVEIVSEKYKSGKPIFPNGNIFIFMLNTGIRVGEATALSWSKYDKENKTITINSSMIINKDENGKSFLEEQRSVKTRNSERILKLNARALAALPPERESGYIFCTKDGNPIHPRSVRDMLDRILKRADIPSKSPHAFRHTFASKLFEKGVDVKIVAELLGHTSVATTYNTYITLIKKQKASAMEAIEDMY